jgi:hypothetical protein
MQSPAPEQSTFDQKLAQYEPQVQAKLQHIRKVVHQAAAQLEGCGAVVEDLKWGQLSFLTVKPKSGTTFRFDLNKADKIAMYVPCSTTLIDQYKDQIGNSSHYVGNRELVLPDNLAKCENELKTAIALALTYHLNK